MVEADHWSCGTGARSSSLPPVIALLSALLLGTVGTLIDSAGGALIATDASGTLRFYVRAVAILAVASAEAAAVIQRPLLERYTSLEFHTYAAMLATTLSGHGSGIAGQSTKSQAQRCRYDRPTADWRLQLDARPSRGDRGWCSGSTTGMGQASLLWKKKKAPVSAPDDRLGNTVLLEDDHIRVWDHRVAVGKTGHLLLHRRPYLSVVIGEGRGETVDPDGNVLPEFQLEPARVHLDGTEDLPEAHALRNIGAHQIAVVIIESFGSLILHEPIEGERPR